MLAELKQQIEGISQRNCKLIVLVGNSPALRDELVDTLCQQLQSPALALGERLGVRLAEIPLQQRALNVGRLLRELCTEIGPNSPLVLDKIELLFDASLQLNVLEILKHQAMSRCVIVNWPGAWQSRRLVYAEIGHPEHRDYTAEGVVIQEIQ